MQAHPPNPGVLDPKAGALEPNAGVLDAPNKLPPELAPKNPGLLAAPKEPDKQS